MGAGIKTGRYRVREDESVDLSRWPPGDTTGFRGSEAQALEESRKLTVRLEQLQETLYAEHRQTPESGEVVIFNRSHYEDVLILRVHGLITKQECLRRYEDIKHFERLLREDRTVIVKFFLHIDKAEQRRRLEDRLTDPSKQWKFSPSDVQERRPWGEYMKAYEDAIQKTST